MSITQPLPTAFLKALKSTFPADFSSAEPGDLATWGRDWTKVFTPAAALVVWPRSTDEVSRLMKLAYEHSVAVVPSGGRTGLAGGAVAKDGEVVLSMDRMRTMHDIDRLGMTVRVQAGAITEAVHHHCAKADLFWPVDFASKGSSQVGGNIATNAGGVRVIRYGLTRNWVLGLQVVTPTGDVLELNGALEKNNTGVDLRQLFIGSEGILGIVTEATLKLTRLPDHVDVFLFSLSSLQAVLTLFEEARIGPFIIMAYEFFTDRCSARLERHRVIRPPFDTPSSHYVLLEVENAKGGALDEWLSQMFEKGVVSDGTLAASLEQQKFLWSLREGISESLSATGLPHKNDISLPISGLSAFCEALESLLAQRYAGWELCLFGHIGDGNLHVNIMKPDAMEKAEFFSKTHAVDSDIFDLVRAHHGSISAEHGIGLLKRDFLGHTRGQIEIALMRRIKAALDPKGLLNPGKVI